MKAIQLRQGQSWMKTFLGVLVSAVCAVQLILPPATLAQAIDGMNLPEPGARINLSEPFEPALLRGILINPDNPLQFDFIITTGDEDLSEEQFNREAEKLIKYFLASLTVPEEEMWVNLSPFEDDRIIPDAFGVTEMGRDLLGQDYILKQLTASLIYPENEIGAKFWERVYAEAKARFGTTDIPINTFNKVWIMPDDVQIYEKKDGAFIVDSSLDVMLEEDYLALRSSMNEDKYGTDDIDPTDAEAISKFTSPIVKDLLLPAIRAEVNRGKNFAQLRQVYSAMLLATWFKLALKESLLGYVYVDQNKILGVHLDDIETKDKLYRKYLAAYQQGVYSVIKEDYDPAAQRAIPRKYFSGGFLPFNSKNLPLIGIVRQGISRVPPDIERFQKGFIQVSVSAEGVKTANPAKGVGFLPHRDDGGVNEGIERAYVEERVIDDSDRLKTRGIEFISNPQVRNILAELGIKESDLITLLNDPKTTIHSVKGAAPGIPALLIRDRNNYQMAHVGVSRQRIYLPDALVKALRQDDDLLLNMLLLREVVLLSRILEERQQGLDYNDAVENAEEIAERLEKTTLSALGRREGSLDGVLHLRVDEYLDLPVDDLISRMSLYETMGNSQYQPLHSILAVQGESEEVRRLRLRKYFPTDHQVSQMTYGQADRLFSEIKAIQQTLKDEKSPAWLRLARVEESLRDHLNNLPLWMVDAADSTQYRSLAVTVPQTNELSRQILQFLSDARLNRRKGLEGRVGEIRTLRQEEGLVRSIANGLRWALVEGDVVRLEPGQTVEPGDIFMNQEGHVYIVSDVMPDTGEPLVVYSPLVNDLENQYSRTTHLLPSQRNKLTHVRLQSRSGLNHQELITRSEQIAQEVSRDAQELGWGKIEFNAGWLLGYRQLRVEKRDGSIYLVREDDETEMAIRKQEPAKEAGLVGKTVQTQEINPVRFGSMVYDLNRGGIDLTQNWLGNDALLEWLDLSPEEMATVSGNQRTGADSRIFRYNVINDTPSRINQSPLRSLSPSDIVIRRAKDYLSTHTYEVNQSRSSKLVFLHYLAVLGRSNAVETTRGYQEVMEDQLLLTQKLREAAAVEVARTEYARIIEDLMWSVPVKVVRAQRQTSQLQLTGKQAEVYANQEPFEISEPADFERLTTLFQSLLKAGEISPYIIINIKNFAPDTYLAYLEALENMSAEYNGQVTFLLSVEKEGVLTHDLPGASTAMRRAADVFGEQFFSDNHVGMITDGGSKTRGGPPTNGNHGQFSLAPLVRVTSEGKVEVTTFLDMNFKTMGAAWLQMRNNYGRNVFLWPASDGIIQFGANPGFGGNSFADLPSRFMSASGGKVELFTPDAAAEIKSFLETRVPDGTSLVDILEADDTGPLGAAKRQLFNEFGNELNRAEEVFNREDLKLGDKGNFVADPETGEIIEFVEKPSFAVLADKVIRLGGGTDVMNIFFLMLDKQSMLDLFVKAFHSTRDPATEEYIGQQKVSVFDRVFGYVTRNDDSDPRSSVALRYINENGVRVLGVNYGEKAYIGDIGNLDLNAQMLRDAVSNPAVAFEDRWSPEQIPENVEVLYEGRPLSDLGGAERNEARFLLQNAKILAPTDRRFVIRLGRGSGIINSIIDFRGSLDELVLTEGSVIIDSELAAPVQFHGVRAVVQGVRHTPQTLKTFDFQTDATGRVYNDFVPVLSLDFFGDETAVSLLIRREDGGVNNAIVRAWNFDYKKPMGAVAESIAVQQNVESVLRASQGDRQRTAYDWLSQQHPRLLNVVGLSEWEDISRKVAGGLTTLSLYDLSHYASYNFEEIKKLVAAPELREQLNYARSSSITPDNMMASEADPGYGGIDFNSRYLKMNIQNRDGGLALPPGFLEKSMIDIDGIVPVIINVAPVTNVPLLLGQDEETADDLVAYGQAR